MTGKLLVMACALAAATLSNGALCGEKLLLSDDFSAEALDTTKWVAGVAAGSQGLVRIEDGVVHVLGVDTGASLTTKMEVPPEHVVKFDYFEPSGERSGGYQNSVAYHATRLPEGADWGTTRMAWYFEGSGAVYSVRDGLWGSRGRTFGFRYAPDKWYHVEVFNKATFTVVKVLDKASGDLKSRITFPHDMALSGKIRFSAGAVKRGRWGFKLDNVRIGTLMPAVSEPPAALVARQAFGAPENWAPKRIVGKTFWHLAPYQPQHWKRWGLESHPLFDDWAAWLHGPADEKLLSARPRPFTMRPAQTEADRELQARIVGQAGERFLGFYGPLNEWGDAFLRTDGRDWLSKRIQTRDEGLAELERLYGERADSTPVKRAIFSLNGYRIFHHHACEWGARSLIAEIGENIPCTNLQLAFARGAAREYDRPWGIDLSSWFQGRMTHYVFSPDFLTMQHGPFAGHSLSLHKRFSFAAWLAGANYIWYENAALPVANEGDIRQVYGYPREEKHNRWVLSPVGEMAEQLFRLAEGKDRGLPYTPVAVMVDFAHGWSPAGCTPHKVWARLPFTKADHMLDEFFNAIYPWNPQRVYENAQKVLWPAEEGYLVNTPFGDVFDVFTNRSCRTLDNYRAVVLVGEVRIDEKLCARLTDYVKTGGTLVVNAEQARGQLPEELLGLRLTQGKASSQAALCKLDNQVLKSGTFEYAKATVTEAQAWVADPATGDPLMTRHKVGQGCVIATTPAYLLDEDNRALPLLAHLLHHLTSNMLPVRVSEGVEYMVNKTPEGWLVGLINNKGIYKKPDGPPEVRPEEEASVMIEFAGAAVTAQEWLTEQKLQFQVDGDKTRITIGVPAGDVRLVAIQSGE